MTRAFVRVPLAISAATLLALSPATAKDPQVTVVAPSKAIHTIRVPYGDLNLREGDGAAILKARVDEASLEVCKATDFEVLMDMVGRSNCITNARIEARPQIASAIQRAKSGQSIALAAAIRVSTAL